MLKSGFRNLPVTSMFARIAILAAVAVVTTAIHTAVAEEGPLLTNSKAPYVHRLTLYDDDGKAISPAKGDTQPFSIAKTCGKCHDMESISGGWHFNANKPGVDKGRPGEPWILADPVTGTQIPISYRGWKGTWKPADLGYSDFDFMKRFGIHMPGGGPGQPNPHDTATTDPRWASSGSMQIDCMSCHNTGTTYDFVARAKPVSEGKFAEAVFATNTLGKTESTGDQTKTAAGAPSTDAFADMDPANQGSGAASKWTIKVAYDKTRFDGDDRVLFPISRNAPPQNCYQCHTTHMTSTNPTAENWKHDEDVHLVAGMRCTDCHRNGIDHKIVRGFEGESKEPMAASLTCQGCHYGLEDKTKPPVAGRLGSPLPEHPGIPPVHFEVLNCTACHSGPWPEQNAKVIETSLNHGLGIPEFGRNHERLPFLQEPVFLKDEEGKLAPHKIVWPSYWAEIAKDKSVKPILPEELEKRFASVFEGRKKAEKEWSPISKDAVTSMLIQLKQAGSGEGAIVYVGGGQLWKLNDSGNVITAENNKAAAPYAWPLAHNVRPAQQSLGIRGCTDCHSKDAPMFFSSVAALTPGADAVQIPMHELAGFDANLQKAWALSFVFRPWFKWFALACLMLITWIFVGYGPTVFSVLRRKGDKR